MKPVEFATPAFKTIKKKSTLAGNILMQGDNLVAMTNLLTEQGLRGKVDLVYIDPPFATSTVFSVTE